jgi:hypothetical protein
MPSVFFLVLGEDQNVIKVGNTGMIPILSQDMVDKILKRGQSVAQTKGHQDVFVVAIASPEDCLPFVALFHTDMGKGISKVNNGEDLGLA